MEGRPQHQWLAGELQCSASEHALLAIPIPIASGLRSGLSHLLLRTRRAAAANLTSSGTLAHLALPPLLPLCRLLACLGVEDASLAGPTPVASSQNKSAATCLHLASPLVQRRHLLLVLRVVDAATLLVHCRLACRCRCYLARHACNNVLHCSGTFEGDIDCAVSGAGSTHSTAGQVHPAEWLPQLPACASSARRRSYASALQTALPYCAAASVKAAFAAGKCTQEAVAHPTAVL